jgi:hypothetical protein
MLQKGTYLENMAHVAECLPGLLLHATWNNLHGLWYETNLTRHIQGVVHLNRKIIPLCRKYR